MNPVTLSPPDRPMPLELRITAPATGSDLPIILLSHGGGESLYLPSKDGYGPLVDFYAAHGFAVIQPTHLSAKAGGLGLDRDAPGFPIFWQSRISDMTQILDRLDAIEAAFPALAGRLDHDRIAIVGHSGGTHTAAMLLGTRLEGADGPISKHDPRIVAGVLMSPLGNGGEALKDSVRERFPQLVLDHSHLTTRTLVIYGDADTSENLTTRGADWHADAYRHGPGADCLLTLSGAKHGLGGIMGYDAKETDDEDPDRLAATRRMSLAYLRSTLFDGDPAWTDACRAFADHAGKLGRVDCK